MTDSSDRHKHLEFIQQTIARMSATSFQIKAWSLGLVSAVMMFANRENDPGFLLVALFPALMLWGLDGYYLGQERRFRALYDHVRRRPVTEIDFSMDTRDADAAATLKAKQAHSSSTQLLFHAAVLIGIGVAAALRWR